MMEDTWRDIAEAPKYEISVQGRVRNKQTGQILRHNLIGITPTVNLQTQGKVICRSVPKLVREAFGG